MDDPIHYLDPPTIPFKDIVIYNDKVDGIILVHLRDAGGGIIHTFRSPGNFDSTSKITLTLGGKVTVFRE